MNDNKGPVLVVMAAGMGSRFGGLKQIKTVDNQGHTLMDYAIYDAVNAGFSEVVFIIREIFADEFKKAVGDRVEKRIPVTYVYQELDMVPQGCPVPEGRQKPWGTTHAIWCCRKVLKGRSFLTINSDDYYGQDAVKKAYDFLKQDAPDNRHGVIGYEIVNTLTEHGTVSRGVCVVDDDKKLVRIDERKEIKQEAGRGYYTTDGGITYHLIPIDAVASMNMWAFRPGFMEDISENFEDRFRKGIQEQPLRFEETLSDAVQNMLNRKTGSVDVISTTDRWFGMTYIEDYDAVRERLAELTQEGLYPDTW